MYTAGPSKAVLLRNEYSEQTSRMRLLRVLDHCSHSYEPEFFLVVCHEKGTKNEPARGHSDLLLALDTAPVHSQYRRHLCFEMLAMVNIS